MKSEESNAVRDAVKRFHKTDKYLGEMERTLDVAKQDQTDAKKALADLLLPADAEYGEKFWIWCLADDMTEALYGVRKFADGTVDLEIRK